MQGQYKNIIFEKQDKIAIITINRPEVRNAVDPATVDELARAFVELRDDPDLWVGIVTGTGDKAFSAGADLASASAMFSGGEKGATSGGGQRMAMPGHGRVYYGVCKGLELWKPVIAAINGFALGGGLEIALTCDLRIAAEHATFGLPEVRWSLIATAGGLLRLPRAIPQAKAMEMILLGQRISAQEALHYGLVNKVVPLDEVMPTALEWANRICENGPLAVRASKECAIKGLDMSLENAMRLDEYLLIRLMQTEDIKEGPIAFLEKRKPEFKGR
jgi:enoyl-CoA hydratase/carnithine racemase